MRSPTDEMARRSGISHHGTPVGTLPLGVPPAVSAYPYMRVSRQLGLRTISAEPAACHCVRYTNELRRSVAYRKGRSRSEVKLGYEVDQFGIGCHSMWKAQRGSLFPNDMQRLHGLLTFTRCPTADLQVVECACQLEK